MRMAESPEARASNNPNCKSLIFCYKNSFFIFIFNEVFQFIKKNKTKQNKKTKKNLLSLKIGIFSS